MAKIDRKQVYNKYNGHCAYCGQKIEYKDMQVDHFIPQSALEKNHGIYYPNITAEEMNDIKNLMPACRLCNHYKRDKMIESFRRDIQSIPGKLARDSYIYRVGIKYGFYDKKPQSIRFYFEEVNND